MTTGAIFGMEYLNAFTFSYYKMRKNRSIDSRALLAGVNEILLLFSTTSV